MVTDPIERIAKAIHSSEGVMSWEITSETTRDLRRQASRAALASLVPEGDALEAAADFLWNHPRNNGTDGKSAWNLAHEDVVEILQASAPLLIAPYLAHQPIHFNSGVAYARSQYAPLVAAVRAWREAFRAYRQEVSVPFDETDEVALERFTAAHVRLRKAEKTLVALPLPDAP